MFRKRHPPPGSRPGTLALPAATAPPRVRVIDYDADRVDDRIVEDVDELVAYARSDSVTWIDIQGLSDERMIRRVGEIFRLHPLALADAVNVPQRPKSEAYDEHHLFITRMGRFDAAARELVTEQVSIFFGPRFVLTLQERAGDVFEPLRQRIHTGLGVMRRSGPDYLACALIDVVIDGYYPILEQLGELLEQLEEATFRRAGRDNLRGIYHAKRQLLELRRAVWPQREAVASLLREENPHFGEPIRLYLRDCYDHAIQIMDVTETFRELAANLMDIYLSTVSQRTNEVMKVLTIMATIFIPLTFLAGVYGMNFEYMPELARWWAYPAVLLLMTSVALGMLVFFWRRGWIGGDARM